MEDRARLLEDVHCDLSLELILVGERYKEQANRHRLDAPQFEVGDFVWLLRRNIATTRPCPKLDYKKLGPFRINIENWFHSYPLRATIPLLYS